MGYTSKSIFGSIVSVRVIFSFYSFNLSYQVWRKSSRAKKYAIIGATKENTYTDKKLYRIVDPAYQVKARYSVADGNPYSRTTVIRHYQTLRNILNYALRFGYLKDDPFRFLSVKDKPKKENRKVDFLPPAEAKRYIECLQEEPLYWRCLENILITTGLRRGEIVGLQWKDIDNKSCLKIEAALLHLLSSDVLF